VTRITADAETESITDVEIVAAGSEVDTSVAGPDVDEPVIAG
jgi:hypothetical protein